MLFWTIVKVGLKSLLANKVRSFLAMLGIIIGVGSVIALVGIGTGANQAVVKRISSLGSNLLTVMPGQMGFGGVNTGTRQNLTLSDAQSLVREVSGIARLSPVSQGRAQVKYSSRNASTQVIGGATTYLAVRDMTIEKGRSFTEAECDSMARVAVLGPVTAEKLFEQSDPLGEIVKVKGINFRVIGVTKAKGDLGFFSMDDQIIVPYTVAVKQLFGQASGGQAETINRIDVQASGDANLTDVQAEIGSILRRRHRLMDGVEDDFTVRNQADMITAMTEITRTLTVLLGAAAAISLIVGGIGIMNIMLVTVTERTREIGIRKAIGAKESAIRIQFLLESIVVCAVGGLLGIGLGLGGVKILALFPLFAPTIEWWSIVLAVGLSGLIGVLAGLYPAWRASRLDPIEALRYE